MALLKILPFFLLIGTCRLIPTNEDAIKSVPPAVVETSLPSPEAQSAPVDSSSSGPSAKSEPNDAENAIEDSTWTFENNTVIDTRRILYSKQVAPGKRPYMVYLSLTKESAKAHKYRGWLCGGVIVHASYVLTSAACVEDADRFYIVSGTTKFVDSFDYKKDDCVCKHRRRVVWKCIPKNYKFDFQDSIKWSSNDIAIVKVDKPFKFGVTEKGCQFAASAITYNNSSRELEKAGTKGYIAGWGSGSNFREGVYRRESDHRPENAKNLQEAKVCVMDNEQCAKKWAQRFRNIIQEYMICTRDVMRRLSEICDKRYANCTDVETRRDSDFPPSESTDIDLGRHLRNPDDYTARRSSMQGGFCENDHGGPLIVKVKGQEVVIGVISACKIDPKTHSCHGPFLYTSVFKNRQFLSCSIHKDVVDNCRRVFRTGITHEEYHVDWSGYKEDDDDDDDADRGLVADSSSDSDSNNDSAPSKKLLREKEEEVKKDNDSDRVEKKEKKKTRQQEPKKEKKEKKKHKKSESHVKIGNTDVFYESSKEANVNDPSE